MKNNPDTQYAVVIEPHAALAQTVADCLGRFGFSVGIASTHEGGAKLAAARGRVAMLAAAVPAPGESHDGAYLEAAREKDPGLPVVVMLSDPGEDISDAPEAAVAIVKPFSTSELTAVVEEALRVAGRSPT